MRASGAGRPTWGRLILRVLYSCRIQRSKRVHRATGAIQRVRSKGVVGRASSTGRADSASRTDQAGRARSTGRARVAGVGSSVVTTGGTAIVRAATSRWTTGSHVCWTLLPIFAWSAVVIQPAADVNTLMYADVSAVCS